MSTQPRLPEGLRDITKSLTKEILREKPRDIYDFAAGYFEAQLPRSERYSVNGYEPGQDYATLLKATSRHTQLPITLVYAIMPDRLIEFIKDFIKAVLKQNPDNICHFAVQYFRHRQKERPMEMTPQDYEEYERYLKSKGRYAYPIKCMCGRWLGRATTEGVGTSAECQGVAKKQTEKSVNGQREEGFDEKSKELRGNYVKVKEVHEKIHVLKQMKALKAIDNDEKEENTTQNENPSAKDIQNLSKELNSLSKDDIQSTTDKTLTSNGINSSSKDKIYPSLSKTPLIMDSLPKDENSISNNEVTNLTLPKDEPIPTTEKLYSSNNEKDTSRDDKNTIEYNEKDTSKDDKDRSKDSSKVENDSSKDEKDLSTDTKETSKDEKDLSKDGKDEVDTSMNEKDPFKDEKYLAKGLNVSSTDEKMEEDPSKMLSAGEKEPLNVETDLSKEKMETTPLKDEQTSSEDIKYPSKDIVDSSMKEEEPSIDESPLETDSKDETGHTNQVTPSQKDSTPSPNTLPATAHEPNEQYLNAVHVIQRFIRKCLRRKKSHFTPPPPSNAMTDEMAALIIQRSLRRLFAAKKSKSIEAQTPMQPSPLTDSLSLIDEHSDISEATSYTSAASTVVAGLGEDKDTPTTRDINDDSDQLESMLTNSFNNQEVLSHERLRRSLEEDKGDESVMKELTDDKSQDLPNKSETSTEGDDEKDPQKVASDVVDEKLQAENKSHSREVSTKSAEATLEAVVDTKEPVDLTEKEPTTTTTEKDDSEEIEESTSPSENTDKDEPQSPKASETNQIADTFPQNDKVETTTLKEKKEEIEKVSNVDSELLQPLEKGSLEEKEENLNETIELKEPLEIDDKYAQQSPQPIDGQEVSHQGDDDEHLKEIAADEIAAISQSSKQTAARDTQKHADPSTSTIPSASEKIATDADSAHANEGGEQDETKKNNNDEPEILVKNLVQNVSGEKPISKVPENEEGVKKRGDLRNDAIRNDNNDRPNEENAKLQAENDWEEIKKSQGSVESQSKEARELGDKGFIRSQDAEKGQDETETYGVNKANDLKEVESKNNDAKTTEKSSNEEAEQEVVKVDPKNSLDIKDELKSKETHSNTIPNEAQVTKDRVEESLPDGLNSKAAVSSAGIMAAVVASQAFGMESAAKQTDTKAEDTLENLKNKADESMPPKEGDKDEIDKSTEDDDKANESKLDSEMTSKSGDISNTDEEDKKIFEILRAATMDDGGPLQAEELAKEILDSVAEKIDEIEKIVPEKVAEQPNDENINGTNKEDEPSIKNKTIGAQIPSIVETLSNQEEPLSAVLKEDDPTTKSLTEAASKTEPKVGKETKDASAEDSVKDELNSQAVSLAGIMAAAVATQAFGTESKEKDSGAKAATQQDLQSPKKSSTKDDKERDTKETTENKEDHLEEAKDNQAVVEDIIEKSIFSVLGEDEALLDVLVEEIQGTPDSKIPTEKEVVKTIKESENAGPNGKNDIDKTLMEADESNVKDNANMFKDKEPYTIENEDAGNGEAIQTNSEKVITNEASIKDEALENENRINGRDDAEDLPSNASFIDLRQIVDEAIQLDKETERENGKRKRSIETGDKEESNNQEQDDGHDTNELKALADKKISNSEEVKLKDDQEKAGNDESKSLSDEVNDSKTLNNAEIQDVESITVSESDKATSEKGKTETEKDLNVLTQQKEATTKVSSSNIEETKEPSLQAKSTEEDTTKINENLANSTTLKNDEEVDSLQKKENQKNPEESSIEVSLTLGEKADTDTRDTDESWKNIQVAEKLSNVDEQLKAAEMDEENNNDLRFNKNIAMNPNKEKDDEKSYEMETKNGAEKDKDESKESNVKDGNISERKSENYLFPLRAALETKDSKGNEIGRQQQQQTSTTTLATALTKIGTQNSPNSSNKVASSNEKSKIVATPQPPLPTSNKLSKTHPLPSNSGSNSNLSSTGSSIVDQKIYTDKYMGLPIAEIHLKSFKAVNALEAFPWFDKSKSPRPSNSDDDAEKRREVSEAGVQVDSGEVAAVMVENRNGKEAREEDPKEVAERREAKPNLKLDLEQSDHQEEVEEPMEKVSYSKEATSQSTASPASIKESPLQTSDDAASKTSDSPSGVPEKERTATYLYGIHTTPAAQKTVYKPPTAFVIPFDTKRKGKGSKAKMASPVEHTNEISKSSDEDREDSIDLESPTKLFAELSAFDYELENDSDDLVQYSLNETRRLGDPPEPPAISDNSLGDIEETDGYVEGDNNDNTSHLSIIMEVSECDDSPSPQASTYDADYWEQLYMKHGTQDRNLHESGKVYNNALEHMRNESEDSLVVPATQGRVKRSYFEKVRNIPEIVKASTTIQRAYRGYAERKKRQLKNEGKETSNVQKEMTTTNDKEATDSEATPDLKEIEKEIENNQSTLQTSASPNINTSPSKNNDDPMFDSTSRMSAEDLLQMSQDSKKPQPSHTIFGSPQSMDDLKNFIEACIRIQRFYRRYVKNRPVRVSSEGKKQTSVVRKASNVKPEDLRDFVEASIKIQRFFRRYVKSKQNKVTATNTNAYKSISVPARQKEDNKIKEKESMHTPQSVIEASIAIQRFYRQYLLRKSRATSRNIKSNETERTPEEIPQEKRVDVVSLMAGLPSIPSNNPSEDDDTSCSESLKSIDDSQLADLTGACVKIQRFYRKYLKDKRENEARKRSGKSIGSINKETKNEELRDPSNLYNNTKDIQDLETISRASIRIQRFYRRYQQKKKKTRPLTSDSVTSEVVIVPGIFDNQELAKLSEACVKIQKFYRQHLRGKRELVAENEISRNEKATRIDLETTPETTSKETNKSQNTKDILDLEDLSEACVTIQRYYRRYANKKREKQQRPLTSDSAASDVVIIHENLDSQQLAKLSEACVKIQKFYRQHLQRRQQEALRNASEVDQLARKDNKAVETDVESSKDLTKLSMNELETSNFHIKDLNSKDVHDLVDLSEACVTIQRFYRQYRSKKREKDVKNGRPVTSDSVASNIVIVPGNVDMRDLGVMAEACVKIQRFYRQYKERKSLQEGKKEEVNGQRKDLQGISRKDSTDEVVMEKSNIKSGPRDIREQLEELTRASIAIQRFYRRYANKKLNTKRPATVDSLANDVIIQPYAGDINDLSQLTEACVKIQRFYRKYVRQRRGENTATTTSSGGNAEFIEPHNSPGAMHDAQQYADASVKIQRFYRRRLQSKNVGKLPKEPQQQICSPTSTSSAVTGANKDAASSIALPISAELNTADDVKAIDKFEYLSRTPSAESHGRRRRSLTESSVINKRSAVGSNDLQHLIEACITIQRFYRRYAAAARRRESQKAKFQNAARIIQRRFRAYKAGKQLSPTPGEGIERIEGAATKIGSGHMEAWAAAIIQNAYREYLQRRRQLTSEAVAVQTEQPARNGKLHAPISSTDNGSIAAVTPDTSTNTPTTSTSKVNWFVGNDPIVPTASTPTENDSLNTIVNALNGSLSSFSTNLIDSACEEPETVQSPTPEQSETVDSPTKRILIANTLNNATDTTLEKQGTGLDNAEEDEKRKGEAENAGEHVKSETDVKLQTEHVKGETEAETERVKRETVELKDDEVEASLDPIPSGMDLTELLSAFLQKERDNALPQPPSKSDHKSANITRLVVPTLAAPQDTPIPYEQMPRVNPESNDSLSSLDQQSDSMTSTSLDGSTTDLEDTSVDSSLDTITEKLQMQQDETIDRMTKRRASQPKIEVALEQLKAATHFEEPHIKALADNDEEDGQVVMQPLQAEEEPRQSTADSATVVMGPNADEMGENFTTEPVFKGAFKRLHTIAGGDERSLFKSVTIDETVQYIEPMSGTSGSSFCLDDDTTAEIRHKMMAYSMSEGDSDYMGVRTDVMGASTDERLPSLGLDDFNITTALGDTVGTSTDTESTIVSAVTKIQAGARGFLARRRLQRFSGGTKSSCQADHKASFGNAAIDESLERLVEDVAAKKIQTAYRKHYRKNLKQRQADAGQSMESSLAAKRLTLQRGDALRNYSTPDEETDASDSGVVAKSKEVSLKEQPKKGKSAVSPRDHSIPRWPTRRQYSMPVQIESEIFRVIPKHRRKRIRSAEADKK